MLPQSGSDRAATDGCFRDEANEIVEEVSSMSPRGKVRLGLPTRSSKFEYVMDGGDLMRAIAHRNGKFSVAASYFAASTGFKTGRRGREF